MPILLNDLQATAAKAIKTYSPKFFDSKLSGRGGNSVGLLSNKNNPMSVNPLAKTDPHDADTIRRVYRAGQTSVNRIPVNPLTTEAVATMKTLPRPDMADLTKIATHANGDLYINMEVQAMTIEDTTVTDKYGATSNKKDFKVTYIVTFYHVGDPTNQMHEKAGPFSTAPRSGKKNVFWTQYTSNPLQELQFDTVSKLKADGYTVDMHMLSDYLLNYDLYDAVCQRSEQWQTTIDKTLDTFFTDVKMQGSYAPNSHLDMVVREQVKYIMSYNIPLDLYKNIYASITRCFPADAARTICKQNLNLLLSDTLGNLSAHKSLINGFTPATSNQPVPASIQRLSREQIRAVMSTEPLILVQAGAGTGKSTLILGRIDYLVHSGVKPEDITVLSFTNAAADNITAKNPNVHSMTIARMIHEIYTANFSNHELSSLDTIVNSLDIYYPPQVGGSSNRNLVTEFQRKLHAMIKNDTNNFTEMNNFIEAHYDEVIAMLDTIGQTSLELEIIICYQKIDSFKEPPTISSKFLIIDEVQDNSIFEFVYTLKYVDKHKESLFIVGDCSQTLYEFRASNPRALNILEGSQTFATYQLNVNYRSNQEILDFANVALQNIEANQYAQIQLQANSLAAVTEQSFLDHVWFNYRQLQKVTDFHQELPAIFSLDVRPYIEKCLNAHEQVAILAFTRRDVAVIKQILENQYPDKSIVSLVPEKMYNTTVISSFIKKYWNDIKFAPYTNIVNIIQREIMGRLQYLIYNDQKAAPRIRQMLTDWAAKNTATIQTWINQVQNGQLTEAELLDLVKDNMIKYEIMNNAIKQSLLSAQNQQAKKDNAAANADFVISTIHSAKGLEFQNVIVLYRNENQMEEDKKRMYYVALTRAMQSEYILAYDTMSSPQIQADYITVLEHLHSIAPAPNSPITMLAARKKRGSRVKV